MIHVWMSEDKAKYPLTPSTVSEIAYRIYGILLLVEVATNADFSRRMDLCHYPVLDAIGVSKVVLREHM